MPRVAVAAIDVKPSPSKMHQEAAALEMPRPSKFHQVAVVRTLLPSLGDLTSAKTMIDETPTQDLFVPAEGPAQEMPSQELFVHSEGPVFQEAFAVVVLTHEASVRATETTNEMSLQRRWRLVAGTEAQAIVFDR